MGIKGLHQIIKKYAENIYVEKHLSDYAYTKVAIDISLYLFKYKAIFRDRWLSAFITLISVFRKNDIHCVFIFDGKAPKEKEEERKARAESREKIETKVYDIQHDLDEYHRTGDVTELLQKVWEDNMGEHANRLLAPGKRKFDVKIVEAYLDKIRAQVIRITEDDLKMAKQLFDILQVPYLQADDEAERFASQLCVRGIVDAVASEDTDVLAYGTPIFITKINTTDETCVEIHHETLMETMNLTPDQFTDLCIMCGTDYNNNMKGVGPETSYKLLVDYGSIEEIEKIIDKKTGSPKYNSECLKYERVRELFSVPEEIRVRIPYCGKPDLVKLRKWLWENNINYNVDNIVRSFQPREMVFEE